MSANAKYQYSPLRSPTDFRLLKLSPSNEPESCLSCQVEVFSLDKSPPYRAISYTWDSPFRDHHSEDYGPSASVNIDVETDRGRVSLRIRRNLYECLCQVVVSGLDYLWVDAICINESDDVERSVQVSLMHRIYGGCKEVIVWLGREDEHLDAYTQILGFVENSKWMAEAGQGDLEFIKTQVNWTPQESAAWLEETLLAEIGLSDPRWASFCRFVERSWFHRTWMVQEVALAPHVLVLCGREVLSWQAMALLSLLLVDSPYANMLAFNHNPERDYSNDLFEGSQIARLAWCRYICQRTNELQSIRAFQNPFLKSLYLYQHVLLLAWSRQASDPRDKIYGALGTVMKLLPSDHDFPIIPDYKISVARLYTNTMWLLLKHISPMSLLSYASRSHSRIDDLPSWVIDFSVIKDHRGLGFRENLGPGPNWNACKHLPSNALRSLESQNILLVQGITLDTIDSVWSHDIEDLLSAYFSLPEPYFNGQDAREVLWRTLVTAPTVPFSDKYQFEFRRWILHSVLRLRSDEARFHSCVDKLQRVNTTLQVPLFPEAETLLDPLQASQIESELGDESKAFAAILRGQVLFSTAKGYVGIAHAGARGGDQVWIICDVVTPLILRPVEGTDQHVLVRECYLHGFMQAQTPLSGEVGGVRIR